jgi:hypothetical protein
VCYDDENDCVLNKCIQDKLKKLLISDYLVCTVHWIDIANIYSIIT